MQIKDRRPGLGPGTRARGGGREAQIPLFFKRKYIFITLTIQLCNKVKKWIFVFPGPRSWLWSSSPAPICIWQSRPSVCIYRPRSSIFVCLFFVLQLKFVIVNLLSNAYFCYFLKIALGTRLCNSYSVWL